MMSVAFVVEQVLLKANVIVLETFDECGVCGGGGIAERADCD